MTESYDKSGSPASIDLPVLLIVRRALLSPVCYFPEFVKFGSITILLGIGARLVLWLLTQAGTSAILSALLLVVVQFAIATPFIVTWTNLMIGGREAIRDRLVFQYGRIEWRYVLASCAFLGVTVLTGGLAGALIAWARRTYDRQPVLEAAVIDVVLLFVLFLASIRFSFLLPAIANDTYTGLKNCWAQSKGYFERLLAIFALTYVPFLVIADIFIRLTRDQDFFGIVIARWIFDSVNATLVWSVFAGATALAYKLAVFKAPVDSLSEIRN
jgi:hypothetical protein